MADLTIEVFHEQQANSSRNPTGTIVLGERVSPAPTPSSASIRLQPQDRRFPLLIAGSETSNIWEDFLFPILHQDLSHIREENLRRMSGLTVIVPSKELMRKTTDIIRSHGYTGKETICWDITSAYPWQLNPLDGSAEDAARTMCSLMTGSSSSDTTENRLAEDHVYFHTKLLKMLHAHQIEIEAIVNEHLLFQKNAPPLSYQELFQTSSCTLDQWLHLYADPYIAKEATRTLHYLIKQKGKPSASSSDQAAAVDEFIEESQKVFSFLSSCYAYKQNDQWKAIRLSQATGTPLYFIARERGEYVCYPPGHPHEGKWVVFDVYADQIPDVISLCMFLRTNTAFRKLMIGQNYINLMEHFERGGILVINTDQTWETAPARSLFETVLMSKIEQAIFSRSDLTDHSLLIGEATRYLIESNLQKRSHFLLRARKTGVFLTMGVPRFSLIRDTCTSTQIENILASFRNRLIFADIYDASVCMLLRMDEPFLHQGPGETHGGHSSIALFRGASEKHFYPVLLKNVPIPL